MVTHYLDYNATTPLDPAVHAAMEPYLGSFFGNPSSVHHVGRRARAALDGSRERVAAVWRCKPSEVTFTSGGTESNNLAILGTARRLRARGRHLITSAIEHHAVLHPFQYLARQEGFELTLLPVDSQGQIDPGSLEGALRPDTILVSVMAANNEIGTIQPVAALGRLCRDRGVLFHTDAVQAFGKLPFRAIDQFEADLVSACAHKFHGPKGAGALFIRSPLQPEPILWGGSHENERRAGTENVAAIVGFAEALERFIPQPVFEPARMQQLLAPLEALVDSLARDGVERRGSRTERLPNTLAFTVDGADSMTLLAGLDLEGVCASSGSACAAGSLEPSHVIRALGGQTSSANSLVRFSVGRENTEREIGQVAAVLPEVLRRAQQGQQQSISL